MDGGDTVLGIVERDQLSAALTLIHRNGHGHHARVLDGARGDLKGQLLRAGVPSDFDVSAAGREAVVILMHAPGRSSLVTDLLWRAGARSVHAVSRAAMSPLT
jgi:hypothetical protein